MFEGLQDRLGQAIKTLRGQGKISEINVAETMKEIRRALLDADVNYKVAKDFTDRVKDKALGQDVLIAVKPGELLTKIVYDELVGLMGGESVGLTLAKTPPTVILMAGLQGSGKTTLSAKLAKQLKSKGKQVLLGAADVYRPAAVDQLKTLGGQIEVDVYAEPGSTDAVGIARRTLAYAKEHGKDTIILDTAGRLAVDDTLMDEIAAIKAAINPTEILFVVDAMTGQDAVNTAQAFHERLAFTGVVLTKLDGDTRGGAALSIRSVVQKPIKFIGTGEKLDALDVFYPDRMASRILGMGDVVTLVERAQAQYDADQAEKLQRKIRKNQFDFEDFLSQLQAIKKMGNLKDLMGMIPGVGKQLKEVDIPDDAFKQIEAIIQSMTVEERRRPDLIDGSRKRRIARGCGVEVTEVNQLLKQFQQMKTMMKSMNKLAGSGRSMAALSNLPGMPRR